MNFKTFQEKQVEELLDYKGCIAQIEQAMAELSLNTQQEPLRQIYKVDTNNVFAIMPSISSEKLGIGTKIVTAYKDPETGKSFHRGVVTLFNKNSGELECVADAHSVTKIRTACASALATKYLARKNVKKLAIFGTGTQAESHIWALTLVRDFDCIHVHGRDSWKTQGFVSRLKHQTGLNIIANADIESTAKDADVICTLTSSSVPFLKREWVSPGTHLNIVGSSYFGPYEVDLALVRDSAVYVDYLPSAEVAATEYILAKQEKLIRDDHIKGEIGSVVLGHVEGRTSENEITMYKSLGHIYQDLGALKYLLSKTNS